VINQSHFTLAFPLKSPADAKALAEQLPTMMPGLFQVEDAIGTIHYSRFTVLSEKTLLFLGDFDGEFGQLMGELAKHAGPVFDFIFHKGLQSRVVGNFPPAGGISRRTLVEYYRGPYASRIPDNNVHRRFA
jgi:hypothetical protein